MFSVYCTLIVLLQDLVHLTSCWELMTFCCEFIKLIFGRFRCLCFECMIISAMMNPQMMQQMMRNMNPQMMQQMQAQMQVKVYLLVYFDIKLQNSSEYSVWAVHMYGVCLHTPLLLN